MKKVELEEQAVKLKSEVDRKENIILKVKQEYKDLSDSIEKRFKKKTYQTFVWSFLAFLLGAIIF